jgi:hypothetical protein
MLHEATHELFDDTTYEAKTKDGKVVEPWKRQVPTAHWMDPWHIGPLRAERTIMNSVLVRTVL